MKLTFRTLFQSRPIRYIFTGGVAYIVEIGVLIILAKLLLFSPQLAVACSFWVGLVVSFLLQKLFTFSNKDLAKRTLGKQTVMYSLLVAFNYLFTIGFVGVFSISLTLIGARTIALACTLCWNYIVYKRIFR